MQRYHVHPCNSLLKANLFKWKGTNTTSYKCRLVISKWFWPQNDELPMSGWLESIGIHHLVPLCGSFHWPFLISSGFNGQMSPTNVILGACSHLVFKPSMRSWRSSSSRGLQSNSTILNETRQIFFHKLCSVIHVQDDLCLAKDWRTPKWLKFIYILRTFVSTCLIRAASSCSRASCNLEGKTFHGKKGHQKRRSFANPRSLRSDVGVFGINVLRFRIWHEVPLGIDMLSEKRLFWGGVVTSIFNRSNGGDEEIFTLPRCRPDWSFLMWHKYLGTLP